jgi:hypothetical protein
MSRMERSLVDFMSRFVSTIDGKRCDRLEKTIDFEFPSAGLIGHTEQENADAATKKITVA